jgi:hypothetical protein
MQLLSCVGKDGTKREFLCSHSEDRLSAEWVFRVRAKEESAGHSFELVLKELDDESMRVVMLNNYGIPDYCGKGIPDALLPYAALVLGKHVQSSPSSAFGGIYRTAAATIVWDRLVRLGKATYDAGSDVYQTV